MALTPQEQEQLNHLEQMGAADLTVAGLSPEDAHKLAELNAMAPPDPLPAYAPMESLRNVIHSMGQGATFGHLPQVEGAVRSRSTSGPEYEAAKAGVRKDLDAARRKNPALNFLGETAGGAAVLPAAEFATGLKTVGAVRSALISALMGGAQNPGGDIDAPGASKKRLYNAIFGAGVGGGMGYLQTNAATKAERMALAALKPTPRDILLARQAGNQESTGRTLLGENQVFNENPNIIENLRNGIRDLLDHKNVVPGDPTTWEKIKSRVIGDTGIFKPDQGLIRNIPRSKEKLQMRVRDAIDDAGAAKAAVIDELDSNSGRAGYIDIYDIQNKFLDATQINPNLSGFENRLSAAQAYISKVARNSPLGNKLTLRDADRLKTAVGKDVDWNRINSLKSDPQKTVFDETLYHLLNDAVDGKAVTLARNPQFGNPGVATQLAGSKLQYGNLKTSERILEKNIAKEEAGRQVSGGDAAATLVGGLTGLMSGSAPASALAIAAATGAGNHIARKYGAQIAAKQLDNVSRLLNSGLYSTMLGTPEAMRGAYERKRVYGPHNTWSALKTTRE